MRPIITLHSRYHIETPPLCERARMRSRREWGKGAREHGVGEKLNFPSHTELGPLFGKKSEEKRRNEEMRKRCGRRARRKRRRQARRVLLPSLPQRAFRLRVKPCLVLGRGEGYPSPRRAPWKPPSVPSLCLVIPSSSILRQNPLCVSKEGEDEYECAIPYREYDGCGHSFCFKHSTT